MVVLVVPINVCHNVPVQPLPFDCCDSNSVVGDGSGVLVVMAVLIEPLEIGVVL